MVDKRREDRDEDDAPEEVDDTLVNRVAERLNGRYTPRDEFEEHTREYSTWRDEVRDRLESQDNWRDNWAQPHIEEAVNFAREGFKDEVQTRIDKAKKELREDILDATDVINETIQEGDQEVDRASRERDDEIRDIATEAKEAADKSARFFSWDTWKIPAIAAGIAFGLILLFGIIFALTGFGVILPTGNWWWISLFPAVVLGLTVGLIAFFAILFSNQNDDS